MPDSIVLDASVAAKLYFVEDLSSEAEAAVRAADSIIAPELLLIELASVASKRVRRGTSPVGPARSAVSSVGGLLDEVVSLIDAGRCGNTDFIVAMVAAGLGVAFLPRIILASRDHRSVRAVVIEDRDMWWRLALIWRRGSTLSPAARRWLEMVAPLLSPEHP